MNNENKSIIKEAFRYSIPVATGFLPLGIAFGILMESIGYNWIYSGFFSFIAFAGSIQYLSISLLTSAFNPLNAFFVSLMVNARHLFYGISLMDKYSDSGKYKNYLIFAMCDETFSITSSIDMQDKEKRSKLFFWVSVFDHFYWVLGSVIGGIIVGSIEFNSMGMDFALTALFVVLFLEQMLKKENRLPGVIGFGVSVISLMIFGSSSMIIPAMIMILAIFLFGGDRICS